jgi:chromosomal replication initiator protein
MNQKMTENNPGSARRNFLRVAGISCLLSPFLNAQCRLGLASAVNNLPEVCPARGSEMDRRNTFALFTVGSCNRFAHAAAWAVAQSPARVYNPLFIHGASGSGKTHLMQAIGWRAASLWNARVCYLSGERFTDEFTDAIQNGTLPEFRRHYRRADILLLDGIQSLAGRETQEEFLHLFNILFDSHRQIVLSSLSLPSETTNLDQRLVARFGWGLTAELHPPGGNQATHAMDLSQSFQPQVAQ